MPSCLMMRVRASVIDVYFNPMPSIVLIWNRRRRTSLPAASISNHTLSTFSAASLQGFTKKKKRNTHNGYVHVCATAPEMAPAASLRIALGFLSPSGVRYWRTYSYTMKLRPTYGATPATVGTIPLYSARKPPSVAYISRMVSHIPGSFSPLAFFRPWKLAP